MWMHRESDNTTDRFYGELDHVFDPFLKGQMKIFLGNFNAKVRREDISKPTTRNKSLHEISNNGVTVVSFVT
jgi:hypothetical protein